MFALSHFGALATQAAHFSADSSEELSSVLLVVSSVAMIASGVGLILLCARALLRGRKPATQPWVAHALAAPTLQTLNYVEELANAPKPVSPSVRESAPPPVSERDPVTLRRPPVTAVSAVTVDSPSPSVGFGPTSADPTLEMDLGAFAAGTSAENDPSPPEPVPASEPTAVREPFLLLAKKPGAVQQFEIPPPPPLPSELVAREDEREPPKVHRSGTVPRANPAEYMRTVTSYNDGARRA